MTDALEKTLDNALNRRLSRREFFGRAAFNARDPYMRRFWWVEKIIKPLHYNGCRFSDHYMLRLQLRISFWEMPGFKARFMAKHPNFRL